MKLTDLQILNRQIVDQIESRIRFEIEFSDAESEALSIYDQRNFSVYGQENWEPGIFIVPLFAKSKKINEETLNELLNYEPKSLTYDQFFDKFYNHF